MPSCLRLARWTLFAAALGCTQPVRTQADAGLPGAPQVRARDEAVSGAQGGWGSGGVEGRVRWLGAPPALAPLQTNASVRTVCGLSVVDPAFRVDRDGGVQDAVVWVEAPPEPAAAGAPTEAVLDQRGCLYLPPVLAARAGSSLRIRNSDPLTHTVHAVQDGQSVFNVAMPLEHMELLRRLPEQPGLVDIRCDVHPWMRAVVRTFDHSHFTTTDPSGHFQLQGLPRGELRLHAWHPRLGEVSRQVRVGEGMERVTLELGGKP